MSTINGNNDNIYTQINKANQASDASGVKSSSQEDSDMFMQLMIAQLKNQDPTSPADTSEFMGQISNMQQVESMNNLTTTIEAMASSMVTSQSALQASSMVGQNIMISTDKTLSNEEGVINGVLSLNGKTDNVRLTVTDANGQVVETLDLGAYGPGNTDFNWKGAVENAGNEYSLKAEAKLENGTYTRIDTYLDNRVTSVTLGQNGIGMRINTAVGSTAIENVLRIGV
ncbi:MAG: flagellar biosynthesis protein FlgD [Oceanospirillaceae bacterium]|nr:flagellar biosynthesis protein FlgD [Oceanospirillaceae bacterium]